MDNDVSIQQSSHSLLILSLICYYAMQSLGIFNQGLSIKIYSKLSNQNPITMIDFVLNFLRGQTSKSVDAYLEFVGFHLELDGLITFARTRPREEGQPASVS